jgi:DNA-binding SARP family transcriptional activator
MTASRHDPAALPGTLRWSADAALDALPYGVLILGAEGVLLHANAAARTLVASIGTAAAQHCGALLGCRIEGGPCERSCMAERAAEAASPSPEIRVDMPGGVAPGALWVTAAPLQPGSGALALMHVRPGQRRDRRRRSEVRWMSGPELRIRALGRTHVEALEDSVDGRWLSQRPGQVLKYLLCNRERVVPVDEIAESIWPGSGRQTVANTRYVIHRLREKLEPRRLAYDSPTFVVAHSGGYALDREHVWIDVDDFEQGVQDGQAAMARMDPISATHHLERAVELYRGDFLADDPYADWANDERYRLAAMATYALRVSVALAHERGDVQAAIGHLDRLTELEPFDSGVHRELISALLGAGLRSQAKRRYDRFAERLQREFGEKVDFDLRSLPTESGD